MRGEVLWRIQERGLRAVEQLVNESAPERFGGEGVAAAHIAYQTALHLAVAWSEHRPLRESEAVAFRVLGELADRGGLRAEDAVGSLEAASDVLLGMVRRDARVAPWGVRTRDAVLTDLEAEAEAFTALALEELRRGLAGEVRRGIAVGRAGVLVRILDGRLAGDELGAAAATVDLDASREYGVVLLVHAQGRTSVLEDALRGIEDRIPQVVDLGLGDSLPLHRRLVFPVVTQGRWIEARADLHDIATKHRVLAVAPEAAPTLAHLAETYRDVERHLGETVAECGYATGIIDPGCVAPRQRVGAVAQDAALLVSTPPAAA